jgi:hypothetical protein
LWTVDRSVGRVPQQEAAEQQQQPPAAAKIADFLAIVVRL